jgi:hypothetical protein
LVILHIFSPSLTISLSIAILYFSLTTNSFGSETNTIIVGVTTKLPVSTTTSSFLTTTTLRERRDPVSDRPEKRERESDRRRERWWSEKENPVRDMVVSGGSDKKPLKKIFVKNMCI